LKTGESTVLDKSYFDNHKISLYDEYEAKQFEGIDIYITKTDCDKCAQ